MKRLYGTKRRDRTLDESDLALNLSFVLHERSDSEAVQAAVKAVRGHARTIDRLQDLPVTTAMTVERDEAGVTYWLTATIGLPHLLADALGTSRQKLVPVDAESTSKHTAGFFRSPAQLTLPPLGTHTIGVAAVVLRPDRRTSLLAIAGIHEWPADRDGAIRSLERLVQAHAGQWMPPQALWPAPAEVLLPDEVY